MQPQVTDPKFKLYLWKATMKYINLNETFDSCVVYGRNFLNLASYLDFLIFPKFVIDIWKNRWRPIVSWFNF